MESKALEVAGYNVLEMMRSDNVLALSEVANLAADQSTKLESLAYMAAYRIYQLYRKVDDASNDALSRHLQMAKNVITDRNVGATALRTLYNEEFYGWSSFDAWATDFASNVPVSRSSVWMKVGDIDTWREAGCDWETVLALLSRVPMAAREAMSKPVKPEALPPAQDTGEPSKAQYLKELAALPPGQARSKVSEDAGEPQIYVTGAGITNTKLYGKALLVHIRVETPSYVEDYDIVAHPVNDHGGWGAVAHWISARLGWRMKIG